MGGANGDGGVYSVPVSGGSLTQLASFSGSNGANPYAAPTPIGNSIYGVTSAPNSGTVFRVPASGGTPTVLAAFNMSNGYEPLDSLTLSGNTLYGTAYEGGNLSLNSGYGDGTVFAINIPAATIALASPINATIIAGGTGTIGAGVRNSAATAANNLNYTLAAAVVGGSASLGAVTPATGSLAPSASQSCTLAAMSANPGVNTISFTASDPYSSNLSQTTTATLTVLDHAAAAFANGSGTLNLNFGTLQLGSGTKDLQFQIENLPAALRARLDLDSITDVSDAGVFSTDAMSFNDLAPGAESSLFDLFANTSQVGVFSGQYQFNLSDEKDLSGHAGQQTLTLNVSADIVPEPATLGLLAAGAVALIGYGWKRRTVKRKTAKPAAFDQQGEDPAILSFPSRSFHPASVARRAA